MRDLNDGEEEMRLRRTAGSLLVIPLLLLAACGGDPSQVGGESGANPSGSSGGSGTEVNFMVANPVITLGHTQLAIAAEKHFYSDEKTKVKYLTSQGTVAVMQAVASGTADMGQADTLAVDAAAEKGVKNVKAVCSYVASNIYSLAVVSDSPITSVSQLKGKKIGITSLATGVYYNALVTLKQAGLSADDVQFVTMGSDAALLKALKSKSIDAVAAIDVNVGTYKNQGVDLRLFHPSGPISWQFNVVVANDDFLKSHRDAVVGVCKAIQEAEYLVSKQPQEAFDLFKQWGGDVSGLTPEQGVNIIRSRSDAGFRTYPEGGNKWGWMNVEAMPELASLYKTLGLLKTSVDVTSAYTNDLLPDLQFDPGRVVAGS